MSKKYLIILGIQFVLMAMFLIYGWYQTMLTETVRHEAFAMHEEVEKCQKFTGRLIEELQEVNEKLKNCK